MAKIAIIIGVSEYQKQNSLPGSLNDAEIINYIIEKTGEYEEILLLTGDKTTSLKLKSQLPQFIDKNKGRGDLQEVFFYFSGHGEYFDNDFYYILSDFEESRRNATTLKNSELDTYIRTLSPTLSVKVVDACNAGVQYIKDTTGLQELIEKGSAKVGLNKVYFLFSSLSDQSSFASASISDYTKSFVSAITETGREDIRYRDIIDYIADDFANNPNQKPFFVVQAGNTELFATLLDDQKNDVRKQFQLVSNIRSLPAKHLPTKGITLADLLIDQSKEYLNDDEIIEAVSRIQSLTSKCSLPTDLVNLFDIKVEITKSLSGLYGLANIGKWLKDKSEFFARVQSRTEEYETSPNSMDRMMNLTAIFGELPDKIKRKREIITGYELTWDKLPYWYVKHDCRTKLPNIPSYELKILYLFSRLDIAFFYAIDIVWRSPGDTGHKTVYGEWKTKEIRLKQLKDDDHALDTIFDEYKKFILDHLTKLAGIQNDPEIVEQIIPLKLE